MSNVVALSQYFTPAWVAEALVRKHFADLGSNDFVIEPTCGPGRFLEAIPQHVPAVGIEIDPELAEMARQRTGRTIITGDIRDVSFPERPTVFIGNPPFKTSLFDAFLDRAAKAMEMGGRIGMILPTYFLQSASRVARYNQTWALQQEMIPRNIYQGLEKPLCFCLFRKDEQRLMVGFSLYHEQEFVSQLPAEAQEALIAGRASWATLVREAVEQLGGVAHLSEIYDYVADRRPTQNPNWKEQIRKVCQLNAKRVDRGQYSFDFAA